MGTHLCKALKNLSDEKHRIVPEGKTFSVSTAFFTEGDGTVRVPSYIQVLTGDDLPAGTIIETRAPREKTKVSVDPSKLLGIPVDPTQTYSIDKEGPKEQTVADLPGPLTANGPISGEQKAAEATPAPAAAPDTEAFSRPDAFKRLKNLGVKAAGSTSDEKLKQMLAEAEAAAMNSK